MINPLFIVLGVLLVGTGVNPVATELNKTLVSESVSISADSEQLPPVNLVSEMYDFIPVERLRNLRSDCVMYGGTFFHMANKVGCERINVPIVPCNDNRALQAIHACEQAGGVPYCDPWSLYCTVS